MAEPTMLIPLPDDMARLMKLTQWQAGEIERLRERVFELEADPKSGDVIPLAEPRCGDLRRSAERCITAWTVVRGGVWDPNGLMDEHMAALRKALGPNVGGEARIAAHQPSQTTTATPQGVASTD